MHSYSMQVWDTYARNEQGQVFVRTIRIPTAVTLMHIQYPQIAGRHFIIIDL